MFVVSGYRLSERYTLIEGGAAFLPHDNTLVISDLHLGYEAVLEGQGLSIPRIQTTKIQDYVHGLIDSFAPTRIVIAGDLKHNFSRNLSQEWNDVVRFVESVQGKVRLEVVKGNHDNFLVSILREHGIPFFKESDLSGVRILHGHEGSHDGRPTIMGHIHPSISLHDGSRARAKSICFLYEERLELLVLPALSILADGTDVARESRLPEMSPLLTPRISHNLVPITVSGQSILKFPRLGEIRRVGEEV